MSIKNKISEPFVKGKVPPYQMVAGVPAKFVKWNEVGMRRMGMNETMIQVIKTQ